MTLLSTRFAGYVFVMLAMLAAGLSTGTRFYYLVFYALLAMLLLGFVSVLWTLLTLRVTLKGVATRVERGERIPAVFTLRHGCPLPVAAIRVGLSLPSACAPSQEVIVSCPPFARRTSPAPPSTCR